MDGPCQKPSIPNHPIPGLLSRPAFPSLSLWLWLQSSVRSPTPPPGSQNAWHFLWKPPTATFSNPIGTSTYVRFFTATSRHQFLHACIWRCLPICGHRQSSHVAHDQAAEHVASMTTDHGQEILEEEQYIPITARTRLFQAPCLPPSVWCASPTSRMDGSRNHLTVQPYRLAPVLCNARMTAGRAPSPSRLDSDHVSHHSLIWF